MSLAMLLPGMSVFAQSAPTVTLTASPSQVMQSVGSSVTYTAHATGISNPEYQFWVENPNGQWTAEQGYSSSSSFTLTPNQSGNYLVTVFVMSQQELQAQDWSAAVHPPLSDGLFVGSSVTVSPSTSTVTAGQPVTLNASASGIFDPQYQFWYKTPSGQWVQDPNGYTGSSTYTFTPTETGTYEFVAYAKSPDAANNPEGALVSNKGTFTVGVGAPSLSAISVTGESSGNGSTSNPATSLNGGSMTLTTTLTDDMGNPMPGVAITYQFSQNGAVPSQLPSVTSNGTAVTGTAGSSSENYTVYTNSSGQATIQVSGPAGSTQAYSVTADAPFQVNGSTLQTSPVSLEFVTSGQVGISPYAPNVGSPFQASLGSAGVVPVTVTLPPVNGVPQANVQISFSAASPAFFTNGSGSTNLGSSQTVYTNSAGQATAYVDSATAGTDLITVTGTNNGVTFSDSVYINWSQPGIPSTVTNFTASNASPQAGQQVTLSGTVEDSAGNPVPNAQLLLAAQNSGGISLDNGKDSYVQNGTTTAFPEVTASNLSGYPANSNFGEVLTANSAGQFSAVVTNSMATSDMYYVYGVENGTVSGSALGSLKVTWAAATSLSAIGVYGSYSTASSATSATSSVSGIQEPVNGSGTVYFAPFTATGPLSGQSITYQLSATNGGKITAIGDGSGTVVKLTNAVSSVSVTVSYSAGTYTLSVPGQASFTSGTSPIVSVSMSNSSTGTTVLTASSGTASSASATFDFVAGAPTNVGSFPVSTFLAPGGQQTITYQVLDSAGNPVANAASTIKYAGGSQLQYLWITAVNGVTLQGPVGANGATEPTPIPLYTPTHSPLNPVNISGVVAWDGTAGDPITVYSNSSGNVTLTLQGGDVQYTAGSGSSAAVYTSGTTSTGTTYGWTYPKASTSAATFGSVYLGNGQPTAGYDNVGTINW